MLETTALTLTRLAAGIRLQVRGVVGGNEMEAAVALGLRGMTHGEIDLSRAYLSVAALIALSDGLTAGATRLAIRPRRLQRLLRRAAAERLREPEEPEIIELLAHELRHPVHLAWNHLQSLAQSLRAAGRAKDAEACAVSQKHLAVAMRLFDFYITAAQRWQFATVRLGKVAAAALRALEDGVDVPPDPVRLEEGPGPPVWGAGEALQQVVKNLVLNAVRASPPGAPVLVRTGGSRAEATLTVLDHGPGVPPAVLARPFVPYRTEAHGVGLGLVICKWIVDRHGGTITLSNSVDGAAVEVRLPAAQSEPAGSAGTG